ncbi:hypothetical protein [Acetobacter pasteurianus]|uniref:hypothetical protein n=1 Tax=Acetobacter pasteurianus TaxID=438 RepID=UPI00162A103C|nr:hypothetical protein [Acetobacter pasteurianus]
MRAIPRAAACITGRKKPNPIIPPLYAASPYANAPYIYCNTTLHAGFTPRPALAPAGPHTPRNISPPRTPLAGMGAMPKARPRRIAGNAWICQIHALRASLLLRRTPRLTATPQASLGAAFGYGGHTSAMLERRWTAPHPCLCIFCNKGAPSARFFF